MSVGEVVAIWLVSAAVWYFTRRTWSLEHIEWTALERVGTITSGLLFGPLVLLAICAAAVIWADDEKSVKW